jgi:TrmH family RNA methyltransferase
MAVEVITGRTNPLMTHIRRLESSRAYRGESGEFVCDGYKLFEEAIKWKARVTTVVYAEGARMLAGAESARTAVVPKDLMRSISPSESPQGVLFLCAEERRALPEKLDGARYIVLDGVQDPGNVGTVLRTADAFDADAMICVNACADIYNPKTVRATMGAVFRRPVYECSAAELKSALTASGIPLYGAALRDDTEDARDADMTRAAVAVGSEGKGLSEEVLALCDRTIRIPMSERCESLNAAVAAAVLLWEMYR